MKTTKEFHIYEVNKYGDITEIEGGPLSEFDSLNEALHYISKSIKSYRRWDAIITEEGTTYKHYYWATIDSKRYNIGRT